MAAFAAAPGRPVEDVSPFRALRFSGEVWAIPEGRIVLAGKPLLEVTAPLPEAQLVETSSSTRSRSKRRRPPRPPAASSQHAVGRWLTSRCAGHGVEAGMHGARAAAMVGFAGTSNVAAASACGLPAVGTMAHSFIEAFHDEAEAFRTFERNTNGPCDAAGRYLRLDSDSWVQPPVT